MQYESTRNKSIRKSSAQVIAQGISQEGGLFVPESFPRLTESFSEMASMSYRQLAKKLFSYFLTDFSEEEIAACVDQAYTSEKFAGEEPVKLIPLKKGNENKFLLELWHGPTCAFKDMALQILPHFLTTALKKTAGNKKAVILVATSGDTGKAALEGFRDVSGTQVLVFYPKEGVSAMQRRQMETQEGNNVSVCAVEGNFDDAQSGVKRIFTDEAIKQILEDHDMIFSSANSINWGRLLPQIVYYFYAYFELYRTGEIPSLETPVNITVPTGNFGNILAAYYASIMGLPVKKFICASNSNNVLTDFIRTGTYDRRREFFTTISPSMDILISSNLERLLYHLSGNDCETLRQWMQDLSESGIYTVSDTVREKMQSVFYGGCCDDRKTAEVIHELMKEEGYLCDPHTAVAVDVYRQYAEETGDTTPVIIASTASPYKFTPSVMEALGMDISGDEFALLDRMEQVSSTKAPAQLRQLKDKVVRFQKTIQKDQMADSVLEMVGISRSC